MKAPVTGFLGVKANVHLLHAHSGMKSVPARDESVFGSSKIIEEYGVINVTLIVDGVT